MNLPTHIIEEEILSWLPVKTLSRFKCVCKHWLGLIESRSFIDNHYSRERDDDRLVLVRNHDKPSMLMQLPEVDLNQRFPQSENIVELMGPQLGLFCQVIYNGDITLFNPATKMLKQVPVEWLSNFVPRIKCVYGFGLDPLSRDYKIVVFYRSLKKPTISVCIYNSTSDSWKVIKVLQLESMKAAHYSGSKTFVSGVYYWLVLMEDHVILAFDMRIETFREIQLPDEIVYTKIVKICARDDSLAMLAYDIEWVDVWVMGKEGEWNRIFRNGPLQTLVNTYCRLWKNELVLIQLNHLILIDISTQKRRKVTFPPQISGYFHFPFFYKESLVSIKGERSYDN